VRLLLEPADNPPLSDRNGGKYRSPLILCLGGQFLISQFLGQFQECTQTVRPIQLAATMESLGVDLEQA
jgi:hypothetical protein